MLLDEDTGFLFFKVFLRCSMNDVSDMSVFWQGTEVVPSNARSHTCLLSGVFIGNAKVLVRLSFGIDGPKQVAMKLAVRSEDPAISDAIHEIVASG